MQEERPYRPFLLVHGNEWIKKSVQFDENFSYAVMVDMTSPDLRSLMNLLIRSRQPYCIILKPAPDQLNSEQLHLITLCLFGAGYVFSHRDPIIGFLRNGEEGKSMRQLSDYLTAQQWSGLICWNFLLDNEYPVSSGGGTPLVIHSQSQIDEVSVTAVFSGPFYIGRDIIFWGENFNDSYLLEKRFQKLSKDVISFQILTNAYQSVRCERDKLDDELMQLKETLKDTQLILSIVRDKYKNDYKDLFTWYQHEYEILPLWYKRFGQALKVMSGKRNWKSLFDRSVKKYVS